VGLPVLSSADAGAGLTPRGSYLLYCGGCHGLNGVSNSRLVPDLKDQAGYFLNLPEGRRYLVRLPNVAFSTTSDQALTELLNYVVLDLGGAGAPMHAKPYTVREVSHLRHMPLSEVSLAQLRQQMVATLIDQFHATAQLRRYGTDEYESPLPAQDR
jgi:hypothetical protein